VPRPPPISGVSNDYSAFNTYSKRNASPGRAARMARAWNQNRWRPRRCARGAGLDRVVDRVKLAQIDMIAVALIRASDDLNRLSPDDLAYIAETLAEAKQSIDRALERIKEAA